MKVKKIALGFSLIVATGLLILSCKKTANVAPEPDKELQSSIDVSYAAMIVTDVDMICAYLGENNLAPKFYLPSAVSSGSYAVNRDTVFRTLFISFNKTKCLDGRLRDGTISMNYSVTNVNAKYYRNFEFVGNVSFFGYKVDGWSIELRNSFFIKNLLTSPSYSPNTTNLSWSLNGDFDMKHPSDPAKNIHANVDLKKTLLNTSSPTVFPVSKLAAINWSLAVVEYKGKMFGETSGNVPFKYEITDANPLVRDFTCYPDKISGVAITGSTVTPRFEEYHPFLNGSASFTTSTAYPRVIHYGSEDRSAPQCDNTGAVTIKGISYPIDFVKEYK